MQITKEMIALEEELSTTSVVTVLVEGLPVVIELVPGVNSPIN